MISFVIGKRHFDKRIECMYEREGSSHPKHRIVEISSCVKGC